ncbi:unnamed protein product [Heligmosomoides polygyrus]|uniref:Uncharacterized protein n=1 Tax=Heligmosomoides polygyrus TaxID=6339 RepID=A0A183GKA9_HELPZ|nr:unnamed protein product [Heligmosomoides polygyrus]
MHTFDELQNMTDQRCKELVIDFVTYLPFRAVQFFQTSLSIASIPLLVYVVKKYIFGSTIHFNVKIIFIMYYLFAIGHALINTTMQIYQTIRSMLSQPCLAFPTRVEYETFNLCLATMTIGMVNRLFSHRIGHSCHRGQSTAISQDDEETRSDSHELTDGNRYKTSEHLQ